MVEKNNTETIHSPDFVCSSESIHSQGVSKGIISSLPISQSPEMSKIPKIVCLPKIRCSNEVDEFSSSNRSSVTLISHCNLTIDSWAEVEFRHANLGDVRRQKRLIQLAEKRGAAPNASIPQACGDTASTKAAYRFYDNQAVTEEDILGSHQKATQERMVEASLVLAVQDTTEIDYTHHPETKGLGMLHDTKHHGFIVHTTLAVTSGRVPLGIIDQQVWTRPLEESGKKHTRKQRPISEKESQKWLNSLEATARLQLPQTRVVNVGDREADVYELFQLAIDYQQEILVRASWNRCVEHPEHYLWEFMENQPIAGELTITVPRKECQPSRKATLSVRYARVTLRPPKRPKSHQPKPRPITLWGVYANEEQSPYGTEAISWLLLTTVGVHSLQQACERIQWYACRWVIELYHKVLKSGCRVEERQFEEADRLRRYIAVDDVIAWRVLYLTMLGRELPDMPCTAILEAHEWQALYCFIYKTNKPPKETPTLREATHWIAKLGGFLGRKGDREPGITVIWRGLQRLSDLAEAWRLFRQAT